MNKNPGQLRAYIANAKYSFIAQTRNPATFIFGFIFPIVFIAIFGLIGNGGQKVTVGIPTNNLENPVSSAIAKQSFVTLEKGSIEELQAKLKRGKLAGIVETKTVENPEVAKGQNFEIQIETSIAQPQEAAAVRSLVSNISNQMNLSLSGVTNPPVTIKQKETTGRIFRYIDFALPGQIGFSLLSTAIFNTVFGFVYLKKALIFKRMFVTPTRPLTILLAQGTSRLISALMQTVIILAVGVFVFNFFLPYGWITFIQLIILSSISLMSFLGLGIFIAGIAKDENSASPMVNLVTLPQFLLSGVFFSTDNFPSWVQPIANNLPLSYFNIAMRNITIEGGSLISNWPYILGIVGWGVASYILAARTFKWE